MRDLVMGVLPPGATVERAIPAHVPRGYTPVVQNRPGGKVTLAERSDRTVTLRNDDARTGFYLVLFLSPEAVTNITAIQQLVSSWRRRR